MKKFARTKTGIFFSTKNVTEEHFNELDSSGLLDRKANCIPALLMEGDLVEYRIKKIMVYMIMDVAYGKAKFNVFLLKLK